MGWFWKARQHMQVQPCKAAFVATNSVCQGQLVPMFWPLILRAGAEIDFAHSSFPWKNLAANNAGVTVVIICFSNLPSQWKRLFVLSANGQVTENEVENINAYIIPSKNVFVEAASKPLSDPRPLMIYGNKPTDGGNLILSVEDANRLSLKYPYAEENISECFMVQKTLLSRLHGSVSGLMTCSWMKQAVFHR